MEKVALILLSTLILSGCSSYGMQGNSAAVQAGAAIGGVLGAIVGDRHLSGEKTSIFPLKFLIAARRQTDKAK